MLRLALCCLPLGLLAPTAALAYDEPPWPDPDAEVDDGGEAASCPLIDQAPEEATPAPSAQARTPLSPALDVLERAVLDETNLLRKDPRGYAKKLEALRPSYDGKLIHRPGQASILTQEGVAALDEGIDALRRAPARLPRLAWSEGLARAAEDHARDLGRTGHLGHDGSDGSGPDKRASRHGTWGGMVAENIAFGPTEAEEIVIGLLVDDGVRDRGHRDVLLTRELFFAGVACGPHPGYGTTCVMDYATSFRSKARGEAPAPPDEAPVVGVVGPEEADGVDGIDEGEGPEVVDAPELTPSPWVPERPSKRPAPPSTYEPEPESGEALEPDDVQPWQPGRAPEARPPELEDPWIGPGSDEVDGDVDVRDEQRDEVEEVEEADEVEEESPAPGGPFIVRYYDGPPPQARPHRGPPGPYYYRPAPSDPRWRRPPPDYRWRRPNPWRYR